MTRGLWLGLLAGGALACGNAAGPGTTGGSGGASATGGASGTGGASARGGATGAGGSGSCTPDYACMPTAPNTGDYYADCVARVNQFRACVCLPPLARWNAGEACADMDAAYDPANGAHAGFMKGICPQEGFAQDECPGWQSETQVVSGCLQQMFDEGPPPTNPCSGSCYK